MTGTQRLSGLQRQVLSLYRACLRSIRTKPEDARPALRSFARDEFEKHRGDNPKNFLRIEHLLRKGRRLMELLAASEARGVALPQVKQRT